MYTVLLLAHLNGAVITGLIIIVTAIGLIRQHRPLYIPLAATLSILTGWQLVSGALLTIAAVEPPGLFAYCRNVVGYLFVISFMLIAINRQMRHADLPWPARRVFVPLTFGTVTVLVVGIMIYS